MARATGEQLLTLNELLAKLRIGRSTFYENQAALKANGLQEVLMGKGRRFREASVDRIIARAAERGEPLW